MSAEVTTEAVTTEEAVTEEKKKGGGKVIFLIILAIALLTGAVVGVHFILQGVNYITTDNARVTTNVIHVMSPIGGTLERFAVSEGHRVEENEIIGWLENVGPIRSPVDGLVVKSYAIENQVVSPMTPVAVIADTGRIHIEANIEETDIMRIERGQAATITIDALGNQQFTGFVSEIGRITQAELTGNVMFFNTGGTFTRVTHLIPVEIIITDDVDLSHLIGVNARVRIRAA